MIRAVERFETITNDRNPLIPEQFANVITKLHRNQHCRSNWNSNECKEYQRDGSQ